MAMRLTIRRRTLVSFQESKDYLLPHQGKMKYFLLILFIPTFIESKKEFDIRLKKWKRESIIPHLLGALSIWCKSLLC